VSTKSREYEYGRIISVDVLTLGSALAVDTAAASTTIEVADAADFDEHGGQLVLNGTIYDYTIVDDETGIITIPAGIAADALEGDQVAVYSPLYELAVSTKIAQVEAIGDDGNTDTYHATVAQHLIDKIAEGVRGLSGELVKLELDGDEWTVVDVLGLAGTDEARGSRVAAAQDQSVVTVVGAGIAQSILLAHEPILNSEHVYLNGLYQPASEWSRRGQTIVVPDPDGLARVNDRLTCEYLHVPGASEPSLFLVGATTAFPGSDGAGTIALPADTQYGDLIVMGVAGGFDGGVTIDADSRLTRRWESAPPYDHGIPYGAAAIGMEDGTAADLGFYIDTDGGGSRAVAVAVFRGSSVVSDLLTQEDPAPSTSFTLSPPSVGPLGITILLWRKPTVSDDPDTPTQPGSTWVDAAYAGESGCAVRISYTTDQATSFRSTPITVTSYAASSRIAAILLGLG